MVFDVVVFGDMEFLGGFLSFPLGGFYAKDILKDQLLLLKLNNHYKAPANFSYFSPSSRLLCFFSILFFF